MNKDPLPTTQLHNSDIFLGGRFAKYIDQSVNVAVNGKMIRSLEEHWDHFV